MPQAEYVTLDDTTSDQLMAVYASSVNPEELIPMVRRLGKLRGCQPGITLMLFPDDVEAPAVLMKYDLGVPEQAPAATALFRRLAKPKLRYTLLKGAFMLVICRCGVVALAREFDFLEGFEPEPTAEQPNFQEVVTKELIEEYAITKDPEPITDELWRAFVGCGIHVKELTLDYQLESFCTHTQPGF